VEVGEFKIGLVHGHQLIPWGDPQALRALASQLDVNIMISGHTGWFEAYEQDDGRLYINPGSLTGAYSGGLNSGESRPSFALMDCQSGGQLTIYVYQLIDGEVKVERLDFTLSVRT
jgi:vacuolar protein sorting-associated protein 29